VSPDRVFHSKIERQRACRARIFARENSEFPLAGTHARVRARSSERAQRPARTPERVPNSHFARIMRPPRSERARVQSRAGWARLFLPPSLRLLTLPLGSRIHPPAGVYQVILHDRRSRRSRERLRGAFE